jgi:lipoprotein Spr
MNNQFQKPFLIILLALVLSSCSRQVRVAQKSGHNREHPVVRNNQSKAGDYERIGDYNYQKADGLASNPTLVSFVDDWLGVAHQIGGKTKSGIDCSGLVSEIMNKVYHTKFIGPSYIMAQKAEPIRREELHEGDLVFFKINDNKVSHVGVYLSSDFFVHATLRRGVMISSLEEDYYKKYFSGAGRIPGNLSTK